LKLIDDGIIQKNTDMLINFGALYLFVLICHTILGYVSFRVAITYENDIYRRLQNLAYEEFVERRALLSEKDSEGELNTFSLNEIPVYMRFLTSIFLSLPLNIFGFIVSAYLMITLHWKFACIVIIMQVIVVVTEAKQTRKLCAHESCNTYTKFGKNQDKRIRF